MSPVCPAATHAALKLSPAWDALPRLKKHGGITEGAQPGTVHEWKNCPKCNSTLVKVLLRVAA